MNNDRTAPPLAVPMLLAVVGIGALATSILLVPPMIRQFAEAQEGAQATAPVAPPRAQAEPTGAAERQPAAVVAEPEPPAPPPAVEQQPVAAVVAPAAPAATDRRQWVINLDPDSNEIDPASDPAIDEIIAVLTADGSARAVLTGVNNPNKSSKRAERAAKVVRERVIADIGVEPHRVRAVGDQDAAVTGLIVRASIEGGGR